MARFRDPVPFPLQLFFGLIATLFFLLVLKSLAYARGKKLWSDYRYRRRQRRSRRRGVADDRDEAEDEQSYQNSTEERRAPTTNFAASSSILDINDFPTRFNNGHHYYYNPWWAAAETDPTPHPDFHDFRSRPYTPENSPPSSTPSPSPSSPRTRPSFDLYFRMTPRVMVTPSPRSSHPQNQEEIADDALPAYEHPPTYLESFYLKP